VVSDLTKLGILTSGLCRSKAPATSMDSVLQVLQSREHAMQWLRHSLIMHVHGCVMCASGADTTGGTGACAGWG
jgi:hypothetical protein